MDRFSKTCIFGAGMPQTEEKRVFNFQNYQDTCGRTLDQTSSLSIFLLRMTEIVTTWRERRIGAQILAPN